MSPCAPMLLPALLIVTGHPATGKTTLACVLANELRLPMVSKDMIKEALFETIGWRDREWSRQVGVLALAMLYKLCGEYLGAGRSLVVESNFRHDLDTPRMAALLARQPFRPVQLRCVARREVMVARYLARIAAGERHPGHCEHPDDAAVALVRNLGASPPLGIGGLLRTVDTSDPAALDLESLVEWARMALHGRPYQIASS